MSWSALFLAHAKPGDIFNAVMCGFLDLLYLDSEHRLRLIEHGVTALFLDGDRQTSGFPHRTHRKVSKSKPSPAHTKPAAKLQALEKASSCVREANGQRRRTIW
ncbi:hypothetical protein ACSS6W_009794 [Trichoderma asperelloides]